MALAQVEFGWGLYAFIALLIITGMLTSKLDNELFWRRIGQLNKEHNN
jgi:paraquat-inducible protein A